MIQPVTLIITSESVRSEKKLSAEELSSYTIGRGTEAALFLNDPGISRKHCRIFQAEGALCVEDLGSQGGTWHNGRRLSTPARLKDGDQIELGGIEIEVRLEVDRNAAAHEATIAQPPPSRRQRLAAVQNQDRTMVSRGPMGDADALMVRESDPESSPQEIVAEFKGDLLLLGRDKSCNVVLDNLMISRQHARVRRTGQETLVEDLGSTNGTYVNGERVVHFRPLNVGDTLSIGPYHLVYDGSLLRSERPETGAEIRVRKLGLQVTDRQTGRPKLLLDEISLTIRPREFVGLLGTSGAGKSTFVGAVSGRRPATQGQVLLNGEDLYARFDAFKAGIGFVPQEVIFHETLPLDEALRYTSQLRLSKDAAPEEVEANIERVLKTVGLTENRQTIIKNLSGGQKKRVSIAMELLSQPQILFLDEVTSGLDPRTEKQMMHLFRELADSGITVICITHYANSVGICDQIAYLNKGLLAFYGPPAQFKTYFGVAQIEEAYDKEDQKSPPAWQAEFCKSPTYEEFIAQRDAVGVRASAASASGRDAKRIDWHQLRQQLSILTRRNLRLLFIDRRNLLLLLGLPPLTAILLCILTASMEAPPQVINREAYGYWIHKHNILCFGPAIIVFLLSMFVSVREIVKELPIYHHERFVNLRIIPYLLSKIGPLAAIGAVQTFTVVLVINLFADMRAGSMAAQFITLFLVGMCGSLLGLVISAAVKSSDWAVMLMIGAVIPQLLFAGALVPVRGASAFIGKGFISSYWALESLKRMVEDYYISNHIGFYVLTERSQPWGAATLVLLVHLVVLAVVLFLLMMRKDGPDIFGRLKQSVILLKRDIATRLAARRATAILGSPHSAPARN